MPKNIKLLFVVNVDWFLVSHRLPILIAAQKMGYEVHVACKFTGYESILRRRGFHLHQLDFERARVGFFSELKIILEFSKILYSINPSIIHLVTIKPVIYGSILSNFFCKRARRIAAISGLGYIFISEGFIAKVKQRLVVSLYKWGLKSEKALVIFQNTDDQNLFISLGIIRPQQAFLIKGSGVDIAEYKVSETIHSPPVVALMARLLKDKGVLEFVEALKKLKNKGVSFRAVLIGSLDENPQSISESDLNDWIRNGYIEYWGYSSRVPEVLSKIDIMVLPSYREGLPKSLIEAAAAGLPVITTDVPGCRDAIIPGETGLLVPVKNIAELADKMELLILDPELARRMGKNGRRWAEATFDIEQVIGKHLTLYAGGTF